MKTNKQLTGISLAASVVVTTLSTNLLSEETRSGVDALIQEKTYEDPVFSRGTRKPKIALSIPEVAAAEEEEEEEEEAEKEVEVEETLVVPEAITQEKIPDIDVEDNVVKPEIEGFKVEYFEDYKLRIVYSEEGNVTIYSDSGALLDFPGNGDIDYLKTGLHLIEGNNYSSAYHIYIEIDGVSYLLDTRNATLTLHSKKKVFSEDGRYNKFSMYGLRLSADRRKVIELLKRDCGIDLFPGENYGASGAQNSKLLKALRIAYPYTNTDKIVEPDIGKLRKLFVKFSGITVTEPGVVYLDDKVKIKIIDGIVSIQDIKSSVVYTETSLSEHGGKYLFSDDNNKAYFRTGKAGQDSTVLFDIGTDFHETEDGVFQKKAVGRELSFFSFDNPEVEYVYKSKVGRFSLFIGGDGKTKVFDQKMSLLATTVGCIILEDGLACKDIADNMIIYK